MSKRVCDACQSVMIEDCAVRVQYDGESIKIMKKKGFLSYTTAFAKAAVCPNCGKVTFYIEDFEKFRD